MTKKEAKVNDKIYDDGLFSERLQALMKMKNLSYRDLGDLLDTTGQSVAYWVKSNNMDYLTLRRLCDIFNLNWVSFRYGEEANPPEISETLVINTRRKLLEELKKDAARFQLLTSACPIGEWNYNLLNHEVSWCKNACEIFGFDPDKDKRFTFNIEDFNATVHPDDIARVTQTWQDHVAGKTPIYMIEHRIIRADGEEAMVKEVGQLIYDQAGLPDSLIGVVIDISERSYSD